MLAIRPGDRTSRRKGKSRSREDFNVLTIRSRIRLGVRGIIYARIKKCRYHLVNRVWCLKGAVTRQSNNHIGVGGVGHGIEPPKHIVQVSAKTWDPPCTKESGERIIAWIRRCRHDHLVQRVRTANLIDHAFDQRYSANRREHLPRQPRGGTPRLDDRDDLASW
jgi:hypothetical protein